MCCFTQTKRGAVTESAWQILFLCRKGFKADVALLAKIWYLTLMFSLCVVLIWVLSLLWGSKTAGYTPTPPALKWHPAYWFAEAVCLGQKNAMGYLGGIVLLVGGLVGSVNLAGGVAGIILLWPLPILLIDFCRRDSKLRGVDYVFFNPFKPVSERPETVTVGGRQNEIYQTIYLYIPDSSWDDIRPLMDDNEQAYLARKRVAPGLFRSEVDADFMLLFDSMRMNRFVIHSENEEAMKSFSEALTAAAAHDPHHDPFERLRSAEHEATASDDAGHPADEQGEDLPAGASEQIINPAFITGTTRDNVTHSGKRGGRKVAPENPAETVHAVGQDALDALDLGGIDEN